MNIAILSYHRIGGSGVVAFEIGRGLAEMHGYDVHFIGLEPPFRMREHYVPNLQFHGIDLNEYPVFDHQPYTLALASQLVDIIKRYDIQVVHSHYALPHAVAAILAKQITGNRIKTVTTLHGTDITVVGAHPSMRNITCFAINNSDVCTAVSNSLKQETIEKFQIPESQIRTVYNFFNPQNFNTEFPVDRRLRAHYDKIIIHVSNLRPVKNPIMLIDIFNKIRERSDQKIGLWIVGEGPSQVEMEARAVELGCLDDVRFLGVCSNLGALLASADILLLPSKKESFGLVALEAMACGVPVIGSRTGGIPEVVEHGETGFLFELDQPDQAVQYGLELIHNEVLYKNIVTNGLRAVEDKFNMNHIIEQYKNIYEE